MLAARFSHIEAEKRAQVDFIFGYRFPIESLARLGSILTSRLADFVLNPEL